MLTRNTLKKVNERLFVGRMMLHKNRALAVESLESRYVLDCSPIEPICTVNVAHDITAIDDQTTLREAILAANASPIINEIRFEIPGNPTIELTEGPLHITRAVVIDGQNRSIDEPREVTLPPVRVLSTNTQSDRIWNLAVIGGVPEDDHLIRISDIQIVGNGKTGGGGGIVISEATQLELDRVTLADWFADAETLGGALLNVGHTTIRNSTISGNVAASGGGGIANLGWLTLYNSTISGNEAGFVDDMGVTTFGSGGGLLLAYGQAFLEHVTITENVSNELGAGVAMNSPLQLRNSIIGGNFIENLMNPADLSDPKNLVFATYSLVQDPNGHVIVSGPSGNLVGISPELDRLADNGGNTLTHLPMPDSPVIDRADGARFTDQRQFTGVVGVAPDMGAVEVGGTPVPDGDFNNDGRLDIIDLDLLVQEIISGEHSPAFDLTQTGLVDSSDLMAWLALAGSFNLGFGQAYLPGDANLDGRVDGLDFAIWNQFKFGEGGAWSRADFNADGFTDGADLLIWNAQRFMASGQSVPWPSRLAMVPSTTLVNGQQPSAANSSPVPRKFSEPLDPAVGLQRLLTEQLGTDASPMETPRTLPGKSPERGDVSSRNRDRDGRHVDAVFQALSALPPCGRLHD